MELPPVAREMSSLELSDPPHQNTSPTLLTTHLAVSVP